MRSILYLITGLFVLFSCGNNEPITKDEVVVEKIPAEIQPEDNFDYDTLQGMYIGDFAGSDIRIILNYVSHKNAIGYNIHKGLQRNIMGKVTRSNDSVQMVLSEPGDNEYDGVFTIDFIGDDHEPTGKWVSNSGEISSKSFKLKKIVEKKEINYEEVTIYNFAHIFSQMNDSIGQYYFEKDGLVRLEYYPDNEESREKEQMKEIKGTWSLNNTRVVIKWEQNDIFPNNELLLDVHEEEYGERSLKGNGKHRLWMMYW
jgi:hypothetical protein